MACVTTDGALSTTGRHLLQSADPPGPAGELARRTALPLYRVRAGLRELMAAGLVIEINGDYGIKQRGAVQVGDVHQRSQVGHGGDPDRALDHAPDHHHEVMGPRDGDHPERLPQTPGLGQLDVDPVHQPGQPGDVRRHQAALVHHHRNPGRPSDRREAVEVTPDQGLLQHGDPELLEHRQHPEGLGPGPAAVRVDPELAVGDLADRLEDLEVVVEPELDLEHRILFGFPNLGLDHVGRVDPDRESRERRPGGVQPPELPERHPQPLADQIVERRRERGAGGVVPHHRRLQRGLGILERERIGGHHRGVDVQRRQDRLRRLAVEPLGRGLTPSLHPVVVDHLHQHRAIRVVMPPGNLERVLGPEGQQLGFDAETRHGDREL